MSKEWGHGFNEGKRAGFDCGNEWGETTIKMSMANEMRVLFCALITAHKRNDEFAFYATVEIVKTILSKYWNFNDEDWAVFRKDCPRKDLTD